ncbi:hypothetical protein CC1G_06464 [Coprinopsis cinerea okayama7|uniref:Checkpoint protein RAD24-like helical bundle domain-containing protein n=1 Tax=Coprinopsis cinerea (strain Okayama-7 / 130 / ATCC MYA-4618 / FGSC 9003) TaxID=240176 RepID=A8NN72_COPC7|nr:hypothetical protein CC1G_06464 [Coprinopsis cinerea okayama7\|eukprot:XP_001835061.2 hypothetical protein CC1G_06464 [Coprinopsis cinerea okayama7\
MAPKAASQPAKRNAKSTAKINTVKLGSQPSGFTGNKRFDPLTAFRNTPPPPPSSSGSDPGSSSQDTRKRPATQTRNSQTKGKTNKKAKTGQTKPGDQLWVDLHEPASEAELAVHVRKVEDVRRWLKEAYEGGPSGKLKKYRRILTLTGPAGTGKTSTIKILAKELDFEIVEWRNAIGEVTSSWGQDSYSTGRYQDYDSDSETLFTKFETFFNRAARCQGLAFSGPSSSSSSSKAKRQLVLLEDLPNILHPKTQSQFHDCLKSLVESPVSDPPVPVVIIISDTGLRGEARDERIAGGFGWGKDKEQVVDVRFNPIAPTLMRKALSNMLQAHAMHEDFVAPSKQALDIVIESSNGDIRSAIMALQFACLVQGPAAKKRVGANATTVMVTEAVTRREQSLALFHLIGKVLYNKRKGDPSSSSASAKDILKEKELDSQLQDPLPLPAHLEHHNRRASRVDVDSIYKDSPIDSSLFSLYIHQNYQQFCNEVEEIGDVADWLSWVDLSGGEAWYQANPHQFHLVALGTMHSLPSPVIRRSQKIYKPEFFDVLQKERDARDAVRLAKEWIVEEDLRKAKSRRAQSGRLELERGDPRVGTDVEIEGQKCRSAVKTAKVASAILESSIDEKDAADEVPDEEELEPTVVAEESTGGWLESDDIEEFD